MKKTKIMALLLSATLVFSGCGNMNNTAKGGLIGGGGGAALGAIIGGIAGHGKGAAIGAAVGAAPPPPPIRPPLAVLFMLPHPLKTNVALSNKAIILVFFIIMFILIY